MSKDHKDNDGLEDIYFIEGFDDDHEMLESLDEGDNIPMA